jgi:hypothetical protein
MAYILYNENNQVLYNTEGVLYKERIPLTWPGSSHFEDEVISLGGSVFTIPNGYINSGKTIGVFYQDYWHTTLDMPNGWSIARADAHRWVYVRTPLTFTDYCSYQFKNYPGEYGGFKFESELEILGYGPDQLYSSYVSCAHANSVLGASRGAYWLTYFSNPPYTIRAHTVTSWILGTTPEHAYYAFRPHAGHEIYQFGAY